MKNLSSPKVVKDIIKKYNFNFSKKLGQNFLIDQNILNKISDGANISKEDGVLEIGPGIGTLTQAIAKKVDKVLAIEIDSKLIPILEDNLKGYPNIQIHHGDILKAPLGELLHRNFDGKKIKVLGNLPYYITSPIIMKLLEEELPIKSITIMVQKEVGQRIQASPGGKDYGVLSIAVQFYSEPKIITNVPPSVFFPPPKVESMVIRLDVLDKPRVEVENRKLFFEIVRTAFSKRRKTLLNALSSGQLDIDKDSIRKILNNVGIDENRRGETLSIEEFSRLTHEFHNRLS